MSKGFLFSAKGRDFLNAQYVGALRSTPDIARELDTHANTVRRALLAHGYIPRNHSQAQKIALSSGRHQHPTLGKERQPHTKVLIRATLIKTFHKKHQEEKAS